MGTAAAKDVLREAIRALNDQDRDRFMALHADDVLVHGPTGDVQGVEAVTEEEFGIFAVFSDHTWTVESIIAEGGLVAVRLAGSGTHGGPLGELEPTGRRVSVVHHGTFRIEDGRVAEVWFLPDRLGMMQQLGATQDPTAR